jgi:hypothetical protein
MKGRVGKLGAAGLTLAAAFALTGATLAAEDGQALEVSGYGSALRGSARDDVTRVAVVRVDGAEIELAVADGHFSYEATGTGAEAESVRAYAGDRLVSVVRVTTVAAVPPRDAAAAAVLASRSGMRLVPVDPATLRPLGRGFDYGRPFVPALSASPDGTMFATSAGRRAVVRLVRFKPFGLVADIRIADDAGGFRSIRELAWIGPDRLLAVVERLSRPYFRHIRERTLVVVDPVARRVVARRPLPKLAIQGGSTTAGGRLVLLLGRSSQRDDRVTVLVADADSVRTKEIVVGRRGGARVQTAFAVAPSGARAFLFTDGWGHRTGQAISVELDTLSAERHILSAPKRGIARALISTVQAIAADDRHVAVTGVVAPTGTPAGGIWLVDTERWTARLLDPRTLYVHAEQERLVTFGPDIRPARSGPGTGVSIFSASGHRLHHLFGTTRCDELVFAGSYGHLLHVRQTRARRGFDLTTGASLGPLPALKEEVLRVVSGVATPARRTFARAGDPFTTVSTRGERARIVGKSRHDLRKSVRAYVLATVEGRTFFRLEGWRRGVTCWGGGRASGPGTVTLGSFGCGTHFPSRKQPIMDFGAMQQSRAGFRVLRVDGFAADAVASVELIAEDGTVTRQTVSRNVFSFGAPPQGALRLVARTADGAAVAERSYAPRPRPTVPPRRPTGAPPKVKRIAGYALWVLVPSDWDGHVYRQLPPPALIGPVLQAANFRLPPPPSSASISDHSGLPIARVMSASGILISLREMPDTCCSSSVVRRLPVRIGRADLIRYQASTEDRSLALKHLRIRGRAFELFVYFGRRDVPHKDLDAANQVLATLVVGLRPPVRINRNPLQHGVAPGVTVDVYRDNLIVFRLASVTSALARRLRVTRTVSLQCVKARFDGHSWSVDGTGASPNFGREMYVSLPTSSLGLYRIAKPPYDGCSLGTTRGWKWNDPHGTHREVEIGFTAIGRRFYDEQAAARDLALFVRQREIQRLRHGGAVPFAALARRYSGRVVALTSASAAPASGQIGYWFGGAGTFTFSTASARGRRLFVEVREGKIVRHNLAQLAFVF